MTQGWPLERKKIWLWGLFIGLAFGSIYLFSSILLPFIAGMLVAYILNPTVMRFQKIGIPRVVGTTLLVLVFFMTIGSALFVAIPFLKDELLKLASLMPLYGERTLEALWPYIDQFSKYVDTETFANFHAKASTYIGDMISWALQVIASLLTNSLALANLISLVVLTPIVAFYLLRDWPTMIKQLDRLLPRDHAETIRHQLSLINKSLGGYIRGQALVCFILILLYTVGLSLAGLNFAITIGIITGVFAFIPYFGFLIGFTAGMGVALAQFPDWYSIGWVAAVYAVGQVVESYLLTPKLVGDRIGLHPVWIIFALLAGGVLFGFLGILMALPVAATLAVLVRFGVQKYLESPYYHHTPKAKAPIAAKIRKKGPKK